MKTKIIFCFFLIFVVYSSELSNIFGQVAGKPTQQKIEPNTASNLNKPISQNSKTCSDIKQVDFWNFTYSTSMTTKFDWHKEVKVSNGEFDERKSTGGGDFYFGVRVLFGDINGDQKDEAIIIASCGKYSYNWGSIEITVYALENGRPHAISNLSEEMIKKDYSKYYPNSVMWSISDIQFSIFHNDLLIIFPVDGTQAEPKFQVTMKYIIKKSEFNTNDMPKREPL